MFFLSFPQTQRITDQWKEPKICVQSQLITWDMYTDHQSTDDQCALMICVAPAVPPVSAHHCQLSVLIHATCQCHISATFQCLPVRINAIYQCPSELPFSAVSATYQCASVPISFAYQRRLTVPVSAAYRCQSMPPISAAYQ
ncbi:unnamed protein product, partial [Staurois parvus]